MNINLNPISFISDIMRYFGKGRLSVKKVDQKWIEGRFEWSKALGYLENDGETLLSLLVVWRHIPWDKLTDAALWDTMQVQLDDACLRWLKIDNSFTELPNVHHYSVYMLAALITKVWNDGLDIKMMRQYNQIIIKAAKDIEQASGHGFRKIIQVQISVTHRTIRDGYLLRKLPVPIFIANIFCLNRHLANLDDMTEILSIQKQGDELLKECIMNYVIFWYK